MATSGQNDSMSQIKRTPKTLDNLKEWLLEKGIQVNNLEQLVQDYHEQKVQNNIKKDSQDNQVPQQDKYNKLMDLMVLNGIQKHLQKILLDAQESSLLQAKQDLEHPLIQTLLTRENLSKAAKRDLDDLNFMCHLTGVKPVQDFEENIFVTTQEAFFESEFLNEKYQMVEAKNNQILQPLYGEKQALRGLLKQIYEAQVYPQGKEFQEVLDLMSQQNKKMEEEAKMNQTNDDGSQMTEDDIKFMEKQKKKKRIDQLIEQSQEYTQAQVTLQSCEKIKYKNFAGLPTDITEARVMIASFQDEIIAKEQKLKQLQNQ